MKLFTSPIGLTVALTIAGLSQCNGQQYLGNYNYDGYGQPPSYNQGYGNNYQGYGNNYQGYGRNRYTNGQIVDKTYFANHNNGNNQVYGNRYTNGHIIDKTYFANSNQGNYKQGLSQPDQSAVLRSPTIIDEELRYINKYVAGVLLKEGEPTSCEVALMGASQGIVSAACFEYATMLNGQTFMSVSPEKYAVLVSNGNSKNIGAYKLKQAIPHPHFNPKTYANNIAIIEFEKINAGSTKLLFPLRNLNATETSFLVRREIDSEENETWHPPLMQQFQGSQLKEECLRASALYGSNQEFFYCDQSISTVTYKPACPLPYGSLYGKDMGLLALYSHSVVTSGEGLCDPNSQSYNYYVVISKYYNWIIDTVFLSGPSKNGTSDRQKIESMKDIPSQNNKRDVLAALRNSFNHTNGGAVSGQSHDRSNIGKPSAQIQVPAKFVGGDLYTIPGNKNVILNPSQTQGEPANTGLAPLQPFDTGVPTEYPPFDNGYVVPDPILIIGQDQPPATTPQPTPVIQQPGSVVTSTVLVPTTVVSVVTVGQQPLQQPVAGSTGGNTINNNITVAAPTGQDKTVTVTPPQPSTVTVSQSPQQQPPASTVVIQPTAAQPTNTVSVIQQPPPPASTVSVIQQPPPPATTVIQQQPPSQGTVTVSAPATVTASTPPQQSTVTVTPPKTVTASTPSTVTVEPPSTATASTPSTVTVTPPKTVTASTPSTVTVSDPGTVTISPSPVEANSTLVVSPSPVLPGANGTHAQDNTTVTVTSTTTIMPVPTTTDEHPMFVISSGLPRPSATASDYVPINGLPTFNSTASESPTQADNARKHIKTWTIIGILIGILAFLALCYLMYRQYKKRNGGVDPYSRVRNWWFSGRHQQERPQSMISTISSPAPSYRTNSYRHSNVYHH